jgi:hypothetical protein
MLASRTLAISLTIPILLLSVVSGYSQTEAINNSVKTEIKTTITYCDLEVPEFWKQANADFYVMYSFEIDRSGKIARVKAIRDEIVGQANVLACLANWSITGLPNVKQFAVVFRWKHGKGWVEQTITGSGFRQVTNVTVVDN